MPSSRAGHYFFAAVSLFLIFAFLLLSPLVFNLHPSQAQIEGLSTAFEAPKHNIWSELTREEFQDVSNFVTEEFSHLNLTKQPRSNRDNYIFFAETLRPNKTDAVNYLYDDNSVPERWAKVAISQHFDDGPYVVFHAVGPLPVSPGTRMEPLTYVFNSGVNYVQNPVQDFGALLRFGFSLAANISDITQDLLGATANPDSPKDGLVCWPRGSRIERGGFVMWFQMFRPGLSSGARTLLPQGIYAKVDATSTDIGEWSVGQYYYNGIIYDNEAELRSATQHPDFVRTPPNVDGAWTDTEDFDSTPPGRELPPPISVQPYGPRYKLDQREQFVSWFGFEFYITTSQATGVSIFDIRFKGERVIYELGLQEALSHYAGADPMQGGLEFLDTFFGMGKQMYELLPGYDCPAYADYLNVSWHQLDQSNVQPNSICIFEYTSDYLLSRHSAQYSVTASRNTYLVVRSVSTVGNYDYTIEYIFYLDGTLEVKVRASGFIFAAFYTANDTKHEDEYGHRLNEAVSSSMHDHVLNFKADLDVAGPTNDMIRLAVEPLTASYTWDQPEVEERNTMHLVEYAVSEETGLDWPRNSGELYIVYSSDKKNKWGERKGYRVVGGTGVASPIHLTIENSTTLGDSARWAEHDLWVLRRKDSEPRSADPLNYFTPHDPLIDFNKMANHETLEHSAPASLYDGDLVVYFNLGGHHIPTSQDIPNTLMHTSASSVMFIPHNFNEREASRESVQGVRLQLKGKNSGGFAGEESVSEDLKNRLKSRDDKDQKRAQYFGTPYTDDMKIPLEAFEPNLIQGYQSSRLDVTDLRYNGSAAGIWIAED